MILSYDEAYAIVDELAKDMPEAFYEELNGGVIMLEEECVDPRIPDLYIMGEYCVDELGKYICLYYGSFAKILEDEPREKWVEELGITLRHEFTHHVESLAGVDRLDREDEAFMAKELELMDWEDMD